ncbi:MBOAT family protein [Spirulina subsalsa FACHB-351]|uniref:MBOAT family protein n=1 Tax=Spirulina subsalsa FACHB-351 TaxID=234711 RepID=A0ABT3L455_9CYAN|nr:MBOAT family protein [Spirulina subsalsa]MCW6036290.1 MBOAT family protein [Spirulina subsalsa FACHB-351]
MSFVDTLYGFFLCLLVPLYWHYGRFTPAFNLNTQGNVTTAKVDINDPSESTQKRRQWLLLLASLFFYALLQVYYIPFLLLAALLNYKLAKAMEARSRGCLQPQYSQLSNQEWEEMQRFWNSRATQMLVIGIVLNILILIIFRYLPFLFGIIDDVLNIPLAQFSSNWLRTNLIVPLGISFFTFECIAYLVDVYRGAPASYSFLQFASYKLFFPKLISGPITRFHQFNNQLKESQALTNSLFTEGLWLMACGILKKALIADSLGIFVDLCYGNLERAGSGDLWLAIIGYGLQLYFDFSGYVDMARGSAMLLGFQLPENFNSPYFTTSIAAFWRRWHMTLGDWLRNYLYFPLGGSRKGLMRTCINLFLIMFLAGIWHGAAWGYVIWGVIHGLALVIHRLTEQVSQVFTGFGRWWKSIPGTVCAWMITQFMVFLSWVFFRLPNVQQANLVFSRLFNHRADVQFAHKVYGEALGMGRSDLVWLVLALVMIMTFLYLVKRGLKVQLSSPVKMALVPVCIFMVWILAPGGGLPYIYFDF